jgi:glycosyltransferase involved in cell wall biosynthesis
MSNCYWLTGRGEERPPNVRRAANGSERWDSAAKRSEVLPNMQDQFSDNDSGAGGGSPLVSIVTCVYNAGEFLRPSVSSIVNQTYRNLDIIIVDDGSTDGCLETITDLLDDTRIRVVRQANATRPVALNRALDLVHGEFYAIQDADDISNPTRIQKQLEAILSRPELAAVFCGYCLLMNERCIAPLLASKSETECKADINAFQIPAHDATGLFRMSIIGDIRYDASLPFVEAYDYILRMGESHPMMVLGDCLYRYRMHSNSLTQSDPDRRDRMVTRMLERACERRGQSYSGIFPGGRHRKYRSYNSLIDNDIASVFVMSVLSQRQTNRRWGAVKTGLQCARLHPVDPYYYKALVYALVPAKLLRFIRSAKRLKD